MKLDARRECDALSSGGSRHAPSVRHGSDARLAEIIAVCGVPERGTASRAVLGRARHG